MNFDNIDNKTDEDLIGDFKCLCDEYNKIKCGQESELKSVENIISISIRILNKIIDNNVASFDTERMSENSSGLLKESLIKITKEAIYIPAPDSELLWYNKKDHIMSSKRRKKLERFNILSSSQVMYGVIRFYKPEKIDDEFKYKVRELIPFDDPIVVDPNIQQDENSYLDSFMPKDFNLSAISDNHLMGIHYEAHDDAKVYSINTQKKPCDYIIEKHRSVVNEMDKRKIEHHELTELDRLSKDIKFDKIYLKDILKDINKGFIVRAPLLSIMGDGCKSGVDNRIRFNINWPEYDDKFIKIIEDNIRELLPENIRDKVEFIPDKKGGKNHFIPIAYLKVELFPDIDREILYKNMGDFMKERINGKGNQIH